MSEEEGQTYKRSLKRSPWPLKLLVDPIPETKKATRLPGPTRMPASIRPLINSCNRCVLERHSSSKQSDNYYMAMKDASEEIRKVRNVLGRYIEGWILVTLPARSITLSFSQ